MSAYHPSVIAWLGAEHFVPADGAVIGALAPARKAATEKRYEGRRIFERAHSVLFVEVIDGAARRELSPRFDVRRHSPDGFETGYNGSGCAQLALAICCDALRDDARASRLYQSYRADVIAKLDREAPFTITAADVIAWADGIEAAA